ncbi:acetyl-CoA carboxylase biotin carboxylase subunit [bacterium AH-315-J21]|nr:acetyl-CoA carboxylase biotin carboxylase subunit [bacterium AH-315-J21]
MFKKILIANRGEIAVRIMRTCRVLGIRTVAVFSESDTNAMHTQLADEAVSVGEASPLESYLVIDKIIAAAKETGADAIHPGYGFLSENPVFAETCEKNGITFIGPSADSMRLMGDKVSARQIVTKAGAPVAPGMNSAEADVSAFKKLAAEVGYPVLIKASAGGGGKGMRLVHAEAELEDALEAAQREARNAFADDRVFLEKFIVQPRHIEFQIIGDKSGNVTHLFERECSIQRRHQKIIEETPSPAVSEELRVKMGESAILIAKAGGYYSTGTVEFLLDKDDKYYFLEMNTRLQVEHPITELVTGLDLVAEQIRIAAGENLSPEVLNAAQRGHAIECRIYAEDAENKFFPSSGTLLKYNEPCGPGVRVDSGVRENDIVGIDYDPILSKLITFGSNREEARLRMIDALERYTILGLKTSMRYMLDILQKFEFISGEIHTGFIEEVMPENGTESSDELSSKTVSAAALAAVVLESGTCFAGASVNEDGFSVPTPWQSGNGWRIGEAE